jgi:hypothetical protein
MNEFPPVLPHGPLEEVFTGVHFVTGAMLTQLMGAHWHFSRNMTVVKDDAGDLTLINSVRLDDAGLAALEAIGRVRHVVRLGGLHGRDDAFYCQRYGARLWAPAGVTDPHGKGVDTELVAGGLVPFAGCRVTNFRTSRVPEALLHIDRDGGIVVACDALQNWVGPDAFFSPESIQTMTGMGFFQQANLGPVYLQVAEPKGEDYAQVRDLGFRHALCGHGSPLRDRAHEAFAARFKAVFDI